MTEPAHYPSPESAPDTHAARRPLVVGVMGSASGQIDPVVTELARALLICHAVDLG